MDKMTATELREVAMEIPGIVGAIAMKKENVRFYGVTEIESGAKLHFLLNTYEEVHGTFWRSLHRVFPRVKQPIQYLRSIQCRNI